MKSISELKEDRGAVRESLDEHIARFEVDGAPEYTEDEDQVTRGYEAQIKELDTQITRLENLEKAKAQKIDRKSAIERKGSPEKQAVKRFSFLRMIRSQLDKASGLYIPLDGQEREMHEEAVRESRLNGTTIEGVGVPSFFFQRALSAGTATEGTETVATELRDLIGFLQPRLFTEEIGVQVITGLQGDVQFPRNDARGAGAWEGEIDVAAEISPTFDTVTMTPHRYSGYTIYSKQLLLQSSIGVERFVRNNISRLFSEAIDSAYINGASGGLDPDGLLNLAGIGDEPTAGGTGGPLTWAIVVNHETNVAAANSDFGSMVYVTTPGVRGHMKQTLREAGGTVYLWEDNAAGSMPGEGIVNGYRAVVSTLMPSNLTEGTGTGLHALAFGRFSDSAIGQWGGIDFVIDPYSLVRNAQIQLVGNIFVDVAFFHAGSFSATQDIAV